MDLPLLQTPRLLVRPATIDDLGAVIDYHRRNREHLEPFSPTPPDSFFTEEFWRARIEGSLDEFHVGMACRFFLFPNDDPAVVIGHVSLSQIFHGPFRACYLGYSIDGARQGKGYAREGVRAAIDYAFDTLKLHRIMANYMPHNVRSGRLLRALGFVVEGYARDYLQINGRWEDHILTSLTNEACEPL